jgi:hypothetical protein
MGEQFVRCSMELSIYVPIVVNVIELQKQRLALTAAVAA